MHMRLLEMNKFLCFLALIFCHNSFSATSKDVVIEKTSEKIVIVTSNNKVRKFTLLHSFDGSVFNCEKTKLFVWGGNINDIKSPQASGWTLIDLNRNKVTARKSEGFGIFEIKFLKEKKLGYVDYQRGTYTVSTETGKIIRFDVEYSDVDFEICEERLRQ
jgi:hypothetical protein